MPFTSSTKAASTAWLKRQQRRPIAPCSKPQRFDGKTGFQSRHPAGRAGRRLRSRLGAVANAASSRPGASPGSPRPCPKASYRLADGEPGPAGARLARSASTASIATRPSPNDDHGAARPADQRGGARSTRPCDLAEATAWVRDLVNTPAGRHGPGRAGSSGPRPGQANIGAKVEVTCRRCAGPRLSDDRRGRPAARRASARRG